MIEEHDVVVLTKDLPEHQVQAGDTAVVVAVHTAPGDPTPLGYALELFTVSGETIDVVDVTPDAIRAPLPGERRHARSVAAE